MRNDRDLECPDSFFDGDPLDRPHLKIDQSAAGDGSQLKIVDCETGAVTYRTWWGPGPAPWASKPEATEGGEAVE